MLHKIFSNVSTMLTRHYLLLQLNHDLHLWLLFNFLSTHVIFYTVLLSLLPPKTKVGRSYDRPDLFVFCFINIKFPQEMFVRFGISWIIKKKLIIFRIFLIGNDNKVLFHLWCGVTCSWVWCWWANDCLSDFLTKKWWTTRRHTRVFLVISGVDLCSRRSTGQ